MDDKDIKKIAEAEVAALRTIVDATEKEDMKRASNMLFAMYKSHIVAGFDKHQALALVIATMQASMKNNSGSDK